MQSREFAAGILLVAQHISCDQKALHFSTESAEKFNNNFFLHQIRALGWLYKPEHCVVVHFFQFGVDQIHWLAYHDPLLSKRFLRSRRSWKPSCSNLFALQESCLGYNCPDSTEPTQVTTSRVLLMLKHTSIRHIIMLALLITNRGRDTALREGRSSRQGGVLLSRVVYGRFSLLHASMLRSFACSL